jgi:hypothetical protein
MMAHQIIPTFTKGAADSLTVTWSISFS